MCICERLSRISRLVFSEGAKVFGSFGSTVSTHATKRSRGNAQAERERRARVTLALAEFEAAQKMVDAANLYANNDRAFQLRWMNIIYELGLQGKNTILLIPSNIPVAGTVAGTVGGSSLPPIGVMGVSELAKRAQAASNDEK